MKLSKNSKAKVSFAIKSITFCICWIMLLLLTGLTTAYAETWYVKTDGLDTNGGTSWVDAFQTIQTGIDAASGDDSVLVADGTYKGEGNKNLNFGGKAITLQSESSAEYCIIDCELDGRGFCFQSIEGESSVVSGFTITNGNAGYGGAFIISVGSSPTIIDCIISNNEASQHGGGIRCDSYSSPTIINCIITGNRANFGGGMGIYQASPKVINCTFSDNSATNDGGLGGSGTPTITNCIFWDDTPNEINVSPGVATVTYSDVQGGYSGEGNIDDDPLFVDPENGDFHLLTDSPCIDAGKKDAPNIPQEDKDGKPRIIDGNADGVADVDMGVYEFGDICKGDFNGDDDVDGSDLAVFAADFGRTDCSGDCEGDFDDDGDVDGSDLAVFAADFGRTDCPKQQ